MKLHRIQNLEAYIEQHGSVSLDKLCEQFAVSKNTIRRDVNELVARGRVRKVYGGVVWDEESILIPSMAQREVTMKEAKQKIAQQAAGYVQDGDIIVLDSGSTVAQMLECLKSRKNLTIITNSVPVLNLTFGYEQFHVIFTGGDLYHSTASFVGVEAMSLLKKLNAATLFLAATGVSLTKGITNYSTIEAEVKKVMIEVSEQKILLLDHTKIDVVSLVTFAELKEMDMLITDSPPPPEYVAYCADYNVEIIVANE